MSNLTKVSMKLTEKDITNTEELEKLLHVETKANAVSAAIAITISLSEHLTKGEQLFIRSKDGRTERLVIPGLG